MTLKFSDVLNQINTLYSNINYYKKEINDKIDRSILDLNSKFNNLSTVVNNLDIEVTETVSKLETLLLNTTDLQDKLNTIKEFDKDGNVTNLEEKPSEPKSNYAVVGL